MDRSYIVEAKSAEFGSLKDVVAVVFVNTELSMGLLADFGLTSMSEIKEVRPLSGQPTEPTMYIYLKGSPSGEIIVKRLGANSSSVRCNGEPSQLIPPVGGPHAESLLYPPIAHIISGTVRNGSRLDPVVGVLFVKPRHGEPLLKPEAKTLKRMGFERINSIDQNVPIAEIAAAVAAINQTSLFTFESSPSASAVTERKLNNDGTTVKDSLIEHRGEPHSVIPRMTGHAADRFVNPRSGLGKGDFPRSPSNAPKPGSLRPLSSIPPSGDQRERRYRS